MVILVAIGIVAYADELSIVESRVESLGCTIYSPSNLFAIYRGMPSDKLESTGLGMREERLDHFLDSSNSEYLAFNEDDSFDLKVMKTKTAMDFQLRDKSGDFLDGFLLTFIPSTEKELGKTIISSEIVRTDYNLYIRYEWVEEHEDDINYVVNYYTVMDGYIYEFCFYCDDIAIADDLVRSMMSCVEWDVDETETIKSELSKVNDEWNLYYIPEKQISIAIPNDYEVVTLNTTESLFFNREEIEYIKDIMNQTGNNLDAIKTDFSHEIIVNVTDNIWPSLGLMSEEMVRSIHSSYVEELKEKNASSYKYEIVT